MQIIMEILKSLLMIAPFVLCALSLKKSNLTQSNRGRQFIMPVLALIYCVVAVIFLDEINDWILKLIAFISGYIPFIGNINWTKGLIYLTNFLLVAVFGALKSVLLPLISGIWSRQSVMEHTSALFYEYNEDVDKWLLKNKSGQLKRYYSGFFFAALFASTLMFILSRSFPETSFFAVSFYPVFGVLVLGEVYFYLDGLTKTEFLEDVLGEDEEAYKVSNYGMLRHILSDLFPDRVLYDNTADLNSGIESSLEALEEMLESDNKSIKALGEYFSALKRQGEDVDVNYIKSCISLLEGKSTLFCNPFYRDLTNYLIFPMLKSLRQYKKCLIILGRESACEDVKQWIDEAIFEATNTTALWKSEILSKQSSQADIGILKFSDLYNLKVHDANRELLEDVGFVLIIEPSKLLATGQIGLKLVVESCNEKGGEIVFAACDRNCDGLVDALSHTLKTSITSVMATLESKANASFMYWKADGPYMHHKLFPSISHYLGTGTEIASVALKHQVASTSWISSESFPVLDMKWIAGQYYSSICRYANLPSGQESFNKAFTVDANLWSRSISENSFLIVEDEFCNLFEMARVFASRAKSQGFTNIISGNYLLRDYMLDNVGTFTADPKAIPTIVADFARTRRNVVLKLIMRMSNGMISEQSVEKEFSLGSIPYTDCFLTLKQLIQEHCGVSDVTLSVHFREELDEDGFSSEIKRFFYLEEQSEISSYIQALKNAQYIVEDEIGDKYYIGARLYGHVFQSLLPGQFLTVAGKYYQVATITAGNGVVLRRAADHITQRKYYRQLRSIHLERWQEDDTMGGRRLIGGIELTHGFCDFKVDTAGYLELESYENISGGKRVEINSIPSRSYRNKSVLRLRLPEADKKVRFTVCVMLNEIFRTTYPQSHEYIMAVMPSAEGMSRALKDLLYGFDGCADEECIYIIEDSEIDLGLIVSVERNLDRYFGIISDFISWHIQKMTEDPDIEPEPVPVPEFTQPEKKKKGIRAIAEKVSAFFKGLFGGRGRKKPKPEEQETGIPEAPELDGLIQTVEPTADSQEDSAEPATETYEPAEADGEAAEPMAEQDIPEAQEQESLEIQEDTDAAEESTDAAEETSSASEEDSDAEESATIIGRSVMYNMPEEEILSEPEQAEDGLDIQGEDEQLAEEPVIKLCKTEYQKHCFLKFGYEELDEALAPEETAEYLKRFRYNDNPLTQVRGGEAIAAELEKTYDPHKYGVHYCDFCGCELTGAEYDVLKDGRERCNQCSATALRTGEDFKKVFRNVMRNMEIFYGIRINVAIQVRMTDAKKLAKQLGEKFVATPGFDGRTLGFAKKDKNGYSIYIENGSPKLAAMATIAHELTHIWQYLNWNDKELSKTYGKKNMLEVYEGMAKWAEIQYLIYLGEIPYAKRQEIATRLRKDVYGQGFIKYSARYPLNYGTKPEGKTPFEENPPL